MRSVNGKLVFSYYKHNPDRVFLCGVEINSDYADRGHMVSLWNPRGSDRALAWRNTLSWLMQTISSAKQASLVSDATVPVPADYGEVKCVQFTGLPCVLWLGGRTNVELKRMKTNVQAQSASSPAWGSASGQSSTWTPYPQYGWGWGYSVPGPAPGTGWQ